MDEVQTHGVARRNAGASQLDRNAEELEQLGFTLVESGYSEAILEQLRNGIETIYARQVDEIGGEEYLHRCNDANVARCPLIYDEAFVDVASNENLMDVVRLALGDNFILMQQNGLLNRPSSSHYQVNWHRDLSYQHWTSSQPLAVNALLALDDFTFETGATHVLPASHLREDFPSDDYVRKFERAIEAQAGTFLVMDAMAYHRAGRNVSRRQRRGVNHLIGRPFMAQQFDLPLMLGERYKSDDFLYRYLGYRWSPQKDVTAWRKQRL
jgi:hypothetical protein